MFTQMSCFYSFHLVHALLAVKIPYLFWQCWRLLGHALQCTPWPSMLSPLKLQLGLFFLHHSIQPCEWWGKAVVAGVGKSSWASGQSFLITHKLGYHFWGLSTSYKDGENGIPFPWRNSFGHECCPNSVCGPIPFVLIRVRPLVSSWPLFPLLSSANKMKNPKSEFPSDWDYCEKSQDFCWLPSKSKEWRMNSRFLLCSTSVNSNMLASFLDYQAF